MDAVTLLPAPPSRPALISLVPATAPHPWQVPLPRHDDPPHHGVEASVDPDTDRVARAVARVVGEVLSGRRPLAQVRPVLGPHVLSLVEHLARSRVAVGWKPGGVRVQEPRPGAAEVVLTMVGPRERGAVALRLERSRGRWSVTELEAGLVPDARRPARA